LITRSASTKSSALRRWALAGAGAIGAALALAACGGGSSSSHPQDAAADPATAVPSTAPIYVSAIVKPEGALAHATQADAKALAHVKEPFAQIVQALEGSGQFPHVDYAKEVKPWLGENVGLFLTSISPLEGLGQALGQSLGGGSISVEALLGAVEHGLLAAKGLQGALVLDTTDAQQAQTFVEKLAKSQEAHSASFRGKSYELGSEGDAEGIVGKFVVIGSEAGLHQVIETILGGPSLAQQSDYAKLVAKGKPSATLLSLFLNSESVATTAGTEGGGSGSAGGALGLLELLPGQPRQIRASVMPESHALSLDVDLLSPSSSAAEKGASENKAAAKLFGELPSGSWLALGTGDVGPHIQSYVNAFGSIVSLAGKSLLSSLGGPALEALVKHLGANPAGLRQIFGGWAGPAGLFVAGTGLFNLQGGLVIESNSPGGPRTALERLGAVLKAAGVNVSSTSIPGAEAALNVKITGLPVVLDAGANASRFALGIGTTSVEAALSSSSTLSQSSQYKEASSALGGGEPDVLLQFSTMVSFIEALGLGESPSLSGAMPYLQSLGTLSGGWQQLGGSIARLHLVLGLAGGGEEG
jgi:hypothetical protein